ncbi:hypothetical protein PCE1_004035 [Barthelona sp. PCE]
MSNQLPLKLQFTATDNREFIINTIVDWGICNYRNCKGNLGNVHCYHFDKDAIKKARAEIKDLTENGKRRPRLNGLINVSQLCYMNSSLQMLAFTKFPAILAATLPQDTPDDVLLKMVTILLRLRYDVITPIDPNPLVDLLKLPIHIQQDSIEFFELLVNFIDRRIKSDFATKFFCISTKFEGECVHCNAKTASNNMQLSLSLPISQNFITSLDEGSTQVIHGYTCSFCHKESDYARVMHIDETGSSAIFRFDFAAYDPLRGTLVKRAFKIFTPEVIIVKNRRYTLQGYINHQGELESGHYVFFRFLNGNFYRMSDENIKKTKKPERQIFDVDTTSSTGVTVTAETVWYKLSSPFAILYNADGVDEPLQSIKHVFDIDSVRMFENVIESGLHKRILREIAAAAKKLKKVLPESAPETDGFWVPRSSIERILTPRCVINADKHELVISSVDGFMEQAICEHGKIDCFSAGNPFVRIDGACHRALMDTYSTMGWKASFSTVLDAEICCECLHQFITAKSANASNNTLFSRFYELNKGPKITSASYFIDKIRFEAAQKQYEMSKDLDLNDMLICPHGQHTGRQKSKIREEALPTISELFPNTTWIRANVKKCKDCSKQVIVIDDDEPVLSKRKDRTLQCIADLKELGLWKGTVTELNKKKYQSYGEILLGTAVDTFNDISMGDMVVLPRAFINVVINLSFSKPENRMPLLNMKKLESNGLLFNPMDPYNPALNGLFPFKDYVIFPADCFDRFWNSVYQQFDCPHVRLNYDEVCQGDIATRCRNRLNKIYHETRECISDDKFTLSVVCIAENETLEALIDAFVQDPAVMLHRAFAACSKLIDDDFSVEKGLRLEFSIGVDELENLSDVERYDFLFENITLAMRGRYIYDMCALHWEYQPTTEHCSVVQLPLWHEKCDLHTLYNDDIIVIDLFSRERPPLSRKGTVESNFSESLLYQ